MMTFVMMMTTNDVHKSPINPLFICHIISQQQQHQRWMRIQNMYLIITAWANRPDRLWCNA